MINEQAIEDEMTTEDFVKLYEELVTHSYSRSVSDFLRKELHNDQRSNK